MLHGYNCQPQIVWKTKKVELPCTSKPNVSIDFRSNPGCDG